MVHVDCSSRVGGAALLLPSQYLLSKKKASALPTIIQTKRGRMMRKGVAMSAQGLTRVQVTAQQI